MPRALAALLVLLAAAVLAAPARAAEPSQRIVGGAETQTEWPFMVYLENGRQEIELGDWQFCAGSLVTPTWVLTAAHCLSTLEITDPLLLVAVRGRHAKSGSDGERIQARRVIQHPDYLSENSHDHDVMLVELSRPAAGAPVKIAAAEETGLWVPGTMATVLGWGATSEGGSGSDVLKEAQVPIVSDADCGAAYAPSGDWHAPSMVCAGYPEGGTDTCQGDSGGPMLVPDGAGGWRQVGVTSWGEGCARAGFPGVYAEAAGDSLRAWIASLVPDAIAPRAASTAPPPAGPPPSSPPPSQSPSPPASQPQPEPAEPRRESKRKRKKAKRACAAKKTRKARRACKRKRKAAARRRAARRSAARR